MSIYTYSSFNYGHTVTPDNQYINFTENGIDELFAVIDVGSYTLGQYADKVAQALNSAVDVNQEYTVTLDRATRKLTISAPSTFDLLISSGTNVSISAFSLTGFTGADLTGANTYTGNIESGSNYTPQFLLQNFVDFDDDVEFAEGSVLQTPTGVVETTSYGTVKVMTCNITLITDIVPQGVIRENPNGRSDFRLFRDYAITKAPMEFVYDIANPGAKFENVILESTPKKSNGLGMAVRELFDSVGAGYFETGNISFRKQN